MPLSVIVAEPLVALGEGDSAFANIFAPTSEIGQARVGVTDQFLENAGTYHTRYADTHYWSMLLDVALARTEAQAPKIIIDIGSGSGNSVLPLLKKYPEAHVVASDISPNLLAILRDYLKDDPSTQQRLSLLCADASQVRFNDGCADLVVGAAILHHIVEPETVIERAFTALKPGGWAIFFEPFRSGSSLLTLAYKQVLRQAQRDERVANLRQRFGGKTTGLDVLARIVHDYDTRVAMTPEQAKQLDDKWMFECAQFDAIVQKQGWAQCKSFSMQDGKAPVRTQTIAYLRLAAELDASALPPWAWNILDEFDAQLSEDVRKSAWMEAMVLLQKPSGSSSDATTRVDRAPFNRWYWSAALDRQGVFLAQHDRSVALYWCGFDTRGHATAFATELTATDATHWTGTLHGVAFQAVLTDGGLQLIRPPSTTLDFQYFLSGDAWNGHDPCGAFANGDANHTLLIESRAGVCHAALIARDTNTVRSAGLQRIDTLWRGALVQYEGGSAPFAAMPALPRATELHTDLRVAAIDASTLAVAVADAPFELYARKTLL
jgi:ubiquinone/menaquinone biosynthesis C-methylase UbiE